jgi:hypothetical protein
MVATWPKNAPRVLGERTPLTRNIHGSSTAFLERANVYSQWLDLPVLPMRAAALGRV